MSSSIGGAGQQNRLFSRQAQGLQQPNRLLNEGGVQVPPNALQAATGCCGSVAPDVSRKLNAIG
jgi:hypothetical protein